VCQRTEESRDASPERIIFIIRHGEKPGQPVSGSEPRDPPGPHGVDYCGNQTAQTDQNCLTPRGWSRAGALVSFFAPSDGVFRTGIAKPQQLLCPGYPKGQTPDLKTTKQHRTYQTSCQLADEVKVDIDFHYHEAAKKELGEDLAAVRTGITSVSWEHTAIPAIARVIAPSASIPQPWLPCRFDVVWSLPTMAAITISRRSSRRSSSALRKPDHGPDVAGGLDRPDPWRTL
jgi:hypothetical protein